MNEHTRNGRWPGVVAAAVLFVLCLAAVGQARADGKDDSSDGQTCPRGQVWDSRSQHCVQAQAGILPDGALADYAYRLAKAGRYQEALGVLDLMRNPNTAMALNYRGYATRKLGRTNEGIRYYLRSVRLDPRYAKVREYLGEAYLIKGEPAKAEAQLQAINAICGIGCSEYRHLAEAIADGSPRGGW